MNHQPHLPGADVLFSHMEGLIANTIANSYWKDISGKFLGANDWQLSRFDIHSYSDIIGATDYEMPWQDYAPVLEENDGKVMAKNRVFIFLEQAKLQSYLSYKAPLLSRQGKIIGIFGLSYLLDEALNYEKIINELYFIGGRYIVDQIKPILLKQQQNNFRFSKRQMECIHYLAQGMTTKQIGITLSLSPRTIEQYIETVKNKLSCTSRAEVIAKSYELGLL